VDGVIIAEPSAGMLSPDLCDKFSSEFIKLLVQDLQDDSFIIILHNCGNTAPLLNSLQKTGAAAIHLGYQCPLRTALKALHQDTLLFGNIDPVNTLKMGKVDEVRQQTITSLEEARGYKNFVISSGCDIPPLTPLENIQSFFDSVSEYNRN
jgi:uroporphyrinogen decarboxylase